MFQNCHFFHTTNRYQELVDKYKVNYILGGAGQNAMRVMSWMLQEKEVGVFCGCVGKDKFGEQMEKEAKEAGVNVQYMIDEKAPTGTCACLVVGTERYEFFTVDF